MANKPLKIGITGGIGAGKSLVCDLFRMLSVPVYDADKRAKLLMVQDEIVINSIKDLFGAEAYLGNDKLNTSYLANHVFNDNKKLLQLNGIVHPAVARDFGNWVLKHNEVAYLLKESALLVESESYKRLDYLITVIAPKDMRIARVLERDSQRTIQNVEDIISKQSSDEEKISKSEFVIVNDNKSLVIPQVLDVHSALINLNQTG
jgi:dephospho-CoA kinase